MLKSIVKQITFTYLSNYKSSIVFNILLKRDFLSNYIIDVICLILTYYYI